MGLAVGEGHCPVEGHVLMREEERPHDANSRNSTAEKSSGQRMHAPMIPLRRGTIYYPVKR